MCRWTCRPYSAGTSSGWSVIDSNGTNLHSGQAVFGMLPFPGTGGAYAEEVVIYAAALALRPDGVGDSDVAGVMAALTAWQSLVEHVGLADGDRLLVHGAAGGVGHMAVQIGAALGAVVVGSASPANEGFVVGLGAGQVLDYHGPALDELDPVDAALDTRGGDDFFRLLELVRPGGSIVTLVGEAPGHDYAAAARGVRVAYTKVGQDRVALDAVTALFAERQLHTHLDSTYPLDQAPLAHARGESGHVRGVIALDTTREQA